MGTPKHPYDLSKIQPMVEKFFIKTLPETANELKALGIWDDELLSYGQQISELASELENRGCQAIESRDRALNAILSLPGISTQWAKSNKNNNMA